MITSGRLQEKILDHPLSGAYPEVSSKLLSDYTISLMIEVRQEFARLRRRRDAAAAAALRCSFKNSFPGALKGPLTITINFFTILFLPVILSGYVCAV